MHEPKEKAGKGRNCIGPDGKPMPNSETLERFIARVEQNAHAEAVEEFYTAFASIFRSA